MKFSVTFLLFLFCLSAPGLHLHGAGALAQPQQSGEAKARSVEQSQQRAIAEGASSQAVLDDVSKRSGFRLTENGLPIYGSQLFQGDFRDLSFSGFNPNYQIGVGDEVQILIWGAMDKELKLTVDPKGNVFIPRVGPVKVQGVRNEELNTVIRERIGQVYKTNIDSYASLNSTQRVKVFVSGHVMKPGLYHGFASDSVLHYLDQAGGVDPQRGSYLKVAVVRAGETVHVLDLYQFLQEGELPLTQFQDGDVILVRPRSNTVSVTGKVANPARFEFAGDSVPLSKILGHAQVLPAATSVSVRSRRDGEAVARVYPLGEASAVRLRPGDAAHVSGSAQERNVLVTLTGEFEGLDSRVFPVGTKLSEAIAAIKPTAMSNVEAAQLFRKSVAERQAELIQQSLDNLERKVLSANSISLEEAKLRKVESETILAFIDRARDVEPTGQVLMASPESAENIYLQDGDVIHIPRKSNLVTVYGEVQYPNTQIHQPGDSVKDYIERAGGFTANANEKELILVKANGMIETIGRGRMVDPEAGDEVIILPAPNAKKLMFAKEISSIIYQIALGARVVIGL